MLVYTHVMHADTSCHAATNQKGEGEKKKKVRAVSQGQAEQLKSVQSPGKTRILRSISTPSRFIEQKAASTFGSALLVMLSC